MKISPGSLEDRQMINDQFYRLLNVRRQFATYFRCRCAMASSTIPQRDKACEPLAKGCPDRRRIHVPCDSSQSAEKPIHRFVLPCPRAEPLSKRSSVFRGRVQEVLGRRSA
jgi:hypothetical protein